MLDSLRSFAGSPLGIVVFAALIIGLLFFGLGGFTGSTNVARVGGQQVSQQDFADAYNAEMRNVGFITPTRAWEAQLPQSVLNNLVQLAAIRDEASRMKMGLSDEAVAEAIAQDPFFQTDGQFNPAILQNVLASEGITEGDLIEEFREGLLRNQIFLAIRGDSTPLPESYRRILNSVYGEQRTIAYAVLTPDLLEEGAEPTEEEIQAYYDDNTDQWQIGEVRTVALLELSPRVLADPDAITDEQVAAEYAARQVENETRNVWIYVFDERDGVPAAEVAENVAAAIEAGQTFDELVEAGEIDPTNLGFVGAGGVNDPAIAEAAFGMEAVGTEIVTGRAGATLVHVSEITLGDLPPLEEIADDIRQELAEEQTTGTLFDLATAIDEGREAGQTLVEVGEAMGLPTRIVSFDEDGNDGLGEPLADLPGGNALLTRAFETDVGTAASPINLTTPGAALWFEILEVAAPRQLDLDEIRNRVVEAWQADSEQIRLDLLAESVAGLLNDGVSTEQIEADFGVTFLTSEAFTRTSSPPPQTTASAIQAAFSGPLGYVATIGNAGGNGRVVLRVTDVVTPDFDPAAEPLPEITNIAGTISDQLALTYIFDLQLRIPLSVNMDLVQQIVGGAP